MIEHRNVVLGESYRDLERGVLRDRMVVIEGPRGTAKTRSILTILIKRTIQFSGARCAILRSTRARLSESAMVTFDEQVLPLFGLPASRSDPSHRSSYVLPNGSRIIFTGMDDIQRGQSVEADWMYVVEATELGAENDLLSLLGSLRHHGVDVPFQQIIADANPASPGHWLNKLAEPADDSLRGLRGRDDYLRTLEFNRRSAGDGKVKRIVTSIADNPGYFDVSSWSLTADGANYMDGLKYLRGHLRQRWLAGLWKAAEGAVYPEFDEARHVVGADEFPNGLPAHWPVYVGQDPGFDHPSAILWFAVSPTNTIYIFDEIYRGGLSVDQQSSEIHARNAGRTVREYVGAPQDMFSHTNASPRSIAEQYLDTEYPIRWQPGPRTLNQADKHAMVAAVRALLVSDPPRLRVFARCTATINEFQSWKFKRTRSGDVPDGDDAYEKENDHAMDVVRFMVAKGIGFAPSVATVYRQPEQVARLISERREEDQPHHPMVE